MNLLEKFAPNKKKKKPLVLTNVGKRAVGGYYIPISSVCLKNSARRKRAKEKKTPWATPFEIYRGWFYH
jgi:hypothetical protein